MKKVFFVTIFLSTMVNGVCFANSIENEILIENEGENKQMKSFNFIEISTINSCYIRDCYTSERENGDATTTEIKVCGPWRQVSCPNTNEESAPDFT